MEKLSSGQEDKILQCLSEKLERIKERHRDLLYSENINIDDYAMPGIVNKSQAIYRQKHPHRFSELPLIIRGELLEAINSCESIHLDKN